MKELSDIYNHKKVEEEKYENWVKKGYFEAGDLSKKPYSIVIPPPNVTGKLHLGHAWDTTLQDMIIRYKKMQGYDALWLPGMDHAGIATQAKVEARMREEGISRYDIGREKFLEKAWSWKEEYASIIRSQWAKLGLALDYSKERFTLDKGLSDAVKEVFVSLYKKGLIYQGKRIINWDPVQRTALSDIEVYHEDIKGYMYYFKYKIADSDEEVIVATTRPETMFGDTALFVHPDDQRYTHLIGKKAINPANGDELPIMADDYIELGKGTSVMKCTPAHDPNDFVLGKKYHLDMPICMNDNGTMNEICGKYAGMDRFECREALLKDFYEADVVDHLEEIIHPVGHSERSHAIVEPYLSKQWFVKMQPLAQAALENQKTDQNVHFIPERFEKIFSQWMENIEDWCISRQLWWGHQIPAWYHKETGEIYVGKKAPEDLENWKQDEDVLDTWFSSALWPFSTMGWPDHESELYKRYFPTDTLVTGYDIIFFWVSRMIFQSLEFTKQRPFKNVLIHGLIRDEQGRKMSKSLGNGVDPMDVVEEYGADTLRFFLTNNTAPGQDMRYVPSKLTAISHFINKIWNSARFVKMNINHDMSYDDIQLEHLNLPDLWILNKLNKVIENVNVNMDKFEFGNVGSELYDFIWNDFCSWYIELSKETLNGNDSVLKKATQDTLVYVLNSIVRLLHPFMPFVTEEIYLSIPHLKESIVLASWPKTNDQFHNNIIEDQFEYLIDIVKGIREIRHQYVIKNNIEVSYNLTTADSGLENLLKDMAPFISKLCNAKCIGYNKETVKNSANIVIKGGNTLSIDLGQYADMEAEKEKLVKEIAKLQKELERSKKMLSNPNFINKAPAAKVEEEKKKQADYEAKYQTAKNKLENM
ncbi:valine-tRNA ligase [Eggerthia catenaformis OT 569 = DSM 20559]|uniref:Valine--tRNA ligase n=1 Tax=Eggerthia catenaformis OT 569 = DSM 20559 TaxID=999415 RepID=M2P7N1_9FIRM|nr:valine--tRNA ligase [Eggerthia catenaformis]EMD16322.1 valine-tRNA ligase [Eggerthia catenaformis OT 569 = DSM 20559]